MQENLKRRLQETIILPPETPPAVHLRPEAKRPAPLPPQHHCHPATFSNVALGECGCLARGSYLSTQYLTLYAHFVDFEAFRNGVAWFPVACFKCA
eukprot:3447927-Pleurochrysis_carterae.AAC.1